MSEAFKPGRVRADLRGVARGSTTSSITDSGTGLVHSGDGGHPGAGRHAGGGRGADGGRCVPASKTLDWLVAHGYAEQVADAVVVLCCDRVSPEIDRERVRAHFEARCRAVVEIPTTRTWPPVGGWIWGAMRDPTQIAFLELGAHIADRFRQLTRVLPRVAYPGVVMTRHRQAETHRASTSSWVINTRELGAPARQHAQVPRTIPAPPGFGLEVIWIPEAPRSSWTCAWSRPPKGCSSPGPRTPSWSANVRAAWSPSPTR